MRIAVLADIHGNLPALEAVLDEVAAESPDIIVSCGDLAPGPMVRDVIERLRSVPWPTRFVLGNGDREIVAAWDGAPAVGVSPAIRENLEMCARGLDLQHRDFLAAFETTVSIQAGSLGTVLFCHGSPRDTDEIVTVFTPEPELEDILVDVAEGVVVGGHTHRQFDRRAAGHRILNAGSVGMPYEGRAGAFWLMLEAEPRMRQTQYDVATALETMGAGGNELTEMFQESLITPTDADVVARFFEDSARGTK